MLLRFVSIILYIFYNYLQNYKRLNASFVSILYHIYLLDYKHHNSICGY